MSEYIWPVIELLTEEECDRIVKKSESGGWYPVGTVHPSERDGRPSDKRVVERSDENYESLIWLHNKIGQVIKELSNDRNSPFNHHIHFVEPLEVLKYGVGGKYDYHYDGEINVPEKNPQAPPGVRKISAIIALNDEFEGGSVDFLIPTDPGEESPYDNGLKDHTVHLNKGDMLVFPSSRWHRVTPVTEGKRYSLVVWCRGPVCR